MVGCYVFLWTIFELLYCYNIGLEIFLGSIFYTFFGGAVEPRTWIIIHIHIFAYVYVYICVCVSSYPIIIMSKSSKWSCSMVEPSIEPRLVGIHLFYMYSTVGVGVYIYIAMSRMVCHCKCD